MFIDTLGRKKDFQFWYCLTLKVSANQRTQVTVISNGNVC